MLFDLSSPRRKTAVRIIFGGLALLFAIGFIGFGIGGELGGGGIVDSLTGGGGDGDTAEQFEQQIEDAEAALETNPNDPRALANLAEFRYLSGQAQLDIDETTGAPSLTEESRGEFEAAVDAWMRYIETDPARPDVSAAGQIVQAYVFLGDLGAAADTYEIVAEANPGVGTLGTLAQYYYYDLDLKGGDKAVARLEELDSGQVDAAVKQLEQLREQVVKEKKRLAKLPASEEAGESQLQSPFGGLDQGSGVPPTSP
jgi:tetratricopeptide (TPR) repeat protein